MKVKRTHLLKTNTNVKFFTEMLEMLDKEDDNKENNCLIDGDTLKENHIELKCSHKFNYLSLLNEIMIQKKKNHLETHKIKPFQIKCPYCRTIHDGILPYILNQFSDKIKGVNWPPSKVLKFKKCTSVLKSGKRKGEICGISCFNTLCNRHTTKKIVPQKNSISNALLCKGILKSGKRKGEICGCKCKEEYCGRHKQKKSI